MSDPRKLKISRRANGELVVKYGGESIENVSALSVSVSPLGVAATLVFTVDEVDVETTIHKIIGCKEAEEDFTQLEVN